MTSTSTSPAPQIERNEPTTAFLKRNHALIQGAVDTQSDIAGAPIILARTWPIDELHARLVDGSPERVALLPKSADLAALIALANSDPSDLVKRFAAAPQTWRSVLEAFEGEIVIMRSGRAEPILRLLRDHWPWKWTELLAMYGGLAPDENAVAAGFYSRYTRKAWVLNAYREPTFGIHVIVGPSKSLLVPTAESAATVRRVVEGFYEDLRSVPGASEIYPIDRYDQFLHDQPPVPRLSEPAIAQHIAPFLAAIRAVGWPKDREADMADIVALAALSYFIASEIPDLARRLRAVGLASARFAYRYLREDVAGVGQIRVLTFTAGTSSSAALSMAFATDADPSPSGELPALNVLETATSEGDVADAAELEESVRARLQSFEYRRRVSQSHRYLEELVFLRHRLADNTGVLTADIHASSRHSLEETQQMLARRIARTVAQLCVSDAAVLYRYDHAQQTLVLAGAHQAGVGVRILTRSDYDWMEDVGHDPAQRAKSVSYTAADRDQATSYNDGGPAVPPLIATRSQACPPLGKDIPRAKSVLAFPIRIFGRLWGVLEILGRRPNQFSSAQVSIIQKITDIIGPFYHEQLVMSTLYRLAASDDHDGVENNERWDRLAEEGARIFLCEAAVVWGRDLLITSRFQLMGAVGRPDLQPEPTARRVTPSFDATTKRSEASRALVEHRNWVSGEIGREPFADGWQDKDHTRSLVKAGYRYIALMPIYRPDGQGIAVLSLYSKKRRFSDNWQSWAQYISQYIAMITEKLNNARELEIRGRRLLAHEVVNAIATVKRAGQNITTYLDELPRSMPRPSILPVWVSDLRVQTQQASEMVHSWANGQDDESPELLSLGLIGVGEERASRGRAFFRAELNTCISSARTEAQSKRLKMSVRTYDSGFYVPITPNYLRIILTNLVSNAIKYSAPAGEIICFMQKQRYSRRFNIQNIGVPMEEFEWTRMFDVWFRGARTKDAVVGSGLGLYITRRVCSMHELEISYEQRLIKGSKKLVWHHMYLDIPNHLVTRG